MDFLSVSSLVVAIISFMVAALIGWLQIKQSNRMEKFEKRLDKRDEKRYLDAIYAEATRFIQKYNGGGYEAEIYLLPLCIAAYQYNSVYPYRREIYREFCGLPEGVQQVILNRYGIDIPCKKSEDYYFVCLNKLKKEIEEYCPNDKDLFYDGGKYLERTLKHHGANKIPDIRCAIDEKERECLSNPIIANLKSARRDMAYKTHITNLLKYEAEQQPISRLSIEKTNLGIPDRDEEILICYLCSVIAKYVPCYFSELRQLYEHTGFEEDYAGVRYMEDMFLDALHNITIYGIDDEK